MQVRSINVLRNCIRQTICNSSNWWRALQT